MHTDLSMQTYEQINIAMNEIFTADNLSGLLDVFVRFPQMPYYNILLIKRQKPDATLICGKQAWLSYGGEITTKKPMTILCPEFVALEEIDEDNGSLVGRTGQLLLKPVPCFDISQVEIAPEKSEELRNTITAPNFIDALRKRNHRVMEDDVNNPKIKHPLIPSSYDFDKCFLLINPKLSPEDKQKEALKAFVMWYINNHYRGDSRIHTEIAEYLNELQDYVIEVLERYYGIAGTFEATASEIFTEPAEIKGLFLRELSNSVFVIIQLLEGKSSLTFNETMFCNIFLTTTDREEILNEADEMIHKTSATQLSQDLLAFRDLFISERTISNESIEELHRRREAQELFTFPSKTYTCNS